MAANDSNSPSFKMRNPESGAMETYAKNPSYLDRIKENLTLSAGHTERVNQARSEYQQAASKGQATKDTVGE